MFLIILSPFIIFAIIFSIIAAGLVFTPWPFNDRAELENLSEKRGQDDVWLRNK